MLCTGAVLGVMAVVLWCEVPAMENLRHDMPDAADFASAAGGALGVSAPLFAVHNLLLFSYYRAALVPLLLFLAASAAWLIAQYPFPTAWFTLLFRREDLYQPLAV